MEVRYSKSIAEPVLAILKERVSMVSHAFPAWCTLLIIKYEDSDIEEGKFSAVIESEYKYRFCKMTLYPGFLTDFEWYGTLIHEIHHSIMVPYTAEAERIVEKFVTDELTKEYLLAMLADLEEQVVEDSKHCVKMLLDFQPSIVVP